MNEERIGFRLSKRRLITGGMVFAAGAALSSRAGAKEAEMNGLELGQDWDKVFPKSLRVDHRKVTFRNRFGITLAADLYRPKGSAGRLPAVAVSGPFGAVKEQSSGLYAQQLAERGFLAIAFDPSFTGESGGSPRDVMSMDLNREDFSAAVDYLSVSSEADPERIGILGVCGWGGIALSAAEVDTRIKATVAVTMYDMPRATALGYFDKMTADERYKTLERINAQRTADFKAGTSKKAGGVVDPLPEDAPQFVKDYYAYYKQPRGYHKRSLNSNSGWNETAFLSLMNSEILVHPEDLRSAVLVVHGEKAHSRYMGEAAFKKLSGANKELLIVPGASHCDLYDNLEKIPLDLIERFFRRNLKA